MKTVVPLSCPLCKSASPVAWFELERGVIYRCKVDVCGLGFIDPQPTDDELERFYDEYYYPDHGVDAVFANSTISKSEQHFEALDARIGLRERELLDYGCGLGNFLDVVRVHGGSASGVEFDDAGRAAAISKRFRVEKTIDAYGDDSFDVVYMNDVIEHLREPVEDLAEIRRRIKPGGVLFVVTMNINGLKSRIIGDRWDVVTNPTHLWFYDETSLTATLGKAGFNRVELQRWPVHFDHHGRGRRLVQRVLQARGWDASLRMLAWRDED